MKLRVAILAALTVVLSPAAALGYHYNGCGGGVVNFGGGDPAGHSWMNACTPAGNVYFFGTFGNVGGGDPSGMCGYLVADGGPVYAGLSGNSAGGTPNPYLAAGAGDYAADHPGTNCGVPS